MQLLNVCRVGTPLALQQKNDVAETVGQLSHILCCLKIFPFSWVVKFFGQSHDARTAADNIIININSC